MAGFILCQVNDTDASFEVPLTLYLTALAACPVRHVERPFTLTQLSAVRFARFQKGTAKPMEHALDCCCMKR